MKKTLGALFVLVAAAIGIAGYFYANLDSLAKKAIEEIGSRVLQVPVTVGGVTLSPTDGAGTLTDFALGNPPGFKTPRALRAGRIELAIEPQSLTKDVIHIRKILVHDIAVSYESSSGGTNFDALKRNAAQFAGTGKKEGPTVKLIVDSLIISGARMTYIGTATLGKPLELILPDIALANIGAKQGGVTPAQLTGAILDAMIHSMTQAVSNSLKSAGKSIGDGIKGLFGK